MSVLTLEAKLERTDSTTPWGFRMQGGKDFSGPLAIQRVNPGSLAAKCGLQQGDIILKIGNTNTDTLRHKEAQDSILAAGNRLDLLLQRIREKKVISLDGGGVPPTQAFQSYETFSAPSINASSVQNAGGYNQSQQTFNTAPRPFVGQPTAPVPFKSVYIDDTLTQKTQSLSLQPGVSDLPVNVTISPTISPKSSDAGFRSVAEKYADLEEPSKPSQHQSRSFKYLQDLMASGKEPPKALKPTTPKALQPRSTSPLESGPPSQVGTGKAGTVKAIMSQRYNTPIGLYSDTEVMTQFEGQSKFLMTPENGSGAPPAPQFTPKPVAPAPVPTYKPAVAQPVAKPWTPAAPPLPSVIAGPKPFVGGASPKPSGVGAKHGRLGDAVVNAPGTGISNRIPICSSCGSPIRGPFVTALGNCWCPDHFLCANPQCGVKLIDIGFVEEGGFLYCEKDYERYLAPHCKKCNNAIIGQCVNALQSTWHPECFTCTQCKQPIGGNQFHIEEGKPYCERDWAVMFQTMCAGCEFPIEPGDRWVEALGKNFHSECFNCSTCQVSLEGQPFVAKGGKAFCKKHSR